MQEPPSKKIERKEKSSEKPQKAEKKLPESLDPGEPVRLNRFLAQCGIASRRECDALISGGKVKVNGQVVTELGTRIVPQKDRVEYRGEVLKPQHFIYILFNKPKNLITTTSDPLGRKTVLDAIESATKERVFPVGRLDRNTTGLLLLTNDGQLAEKLTHPSHRVRKIYRVRLDKPIPAEDMQRLLDGIQLEDGPAKVDKIDYADGKGPDEVGVEIHIGRNRIVRRMFEALGYQVVNLDRVSIAHLTKKNLPRGKWRQLTDKEIGFLKMI